MSIVCSATPNTSKTIESAKTLMTTRIKILSSRDERRFAFTAASNVARQGLGACVDIRLGAALDLLPKEPWDASTWSQWTGAVKTLTGRKGRALFHPLRLALTGAETGPELAVLLPLIGQAKAAARLAGNGH